jgi:hypothetical protein
VYFPDERTEFISILGGPPPDAAGIPRFQKGWVVPLIVHEFCHSYVNPVVNRHRDKLKAAGEIIYPHVESNMRRWGYNRWYVMIQEYLVRACVIRYLASEGDSRGKERRIRRDEEAGFEGIADVARLLIGYERNRERYPRLEYFIPEIVDFFDKWAGEFKKRGRS